MANTKRKGSTNMDKTYILAVPEKYQPWAKELSMYSAKIYSKAVAIAKMQMWFQLPQGWGRCSKHL